MIQIFFQQENPLNFDTENTISPQFQKDLNNRRCHHLQTLDFPLFFSSY